MKKLAAGAAVAALSFVGVGGAVAGSASAATTKPSAQDVSWMQANAQTDLTEISAGSLAMSKSTDSGVLNLAKVTMSQHETVLAKLKTLATTDGVTLPTTPNAMQLAQAAQLKTLSGSSFDLTYDNDQIAGHEQSISMTNTEISSGSDPSVVAFAKYYLPIAQYHLQLADSLHTELTSASSGATPSGVETGTGGGANHLSPSDDVLLALAAVGLVGAAVAGRRLVRS